MQYSSGVVTLPLCAIPHILLGGSRMAKIEQSHFYDRPASPLSPRRIGRRVLALLGQTDERRQRRAGR